MGYLIPSPATASRRRSGSTSGSDVSQLNAASHADSPRITFPEPIAARIAEPELKCDQELAEPEACWCIPIAEWEDTTWTIELALGSAAAPLPSSDAKNEMTPVARPREDELDHTTPL
jgi:hypothetical protein